MIPRFRIRLATTLALAIAPVAVACYMKVSSGVKPESLDKGNLPVTVKSPVKAHLTDGSTIVFREGIILRRDTIYPRGEGARYDARNNVIDKVHVPLDSVLGLEQYTTRTAVGQTLVMSTVMTGGAVLLGALASVAIFGSCPTIYADSAGTPVLQAEVFATRISPLLEARDIDLLSARPDRAGMLTLEVRNEALETHYINQFELLEVRHAKADRLIPDEHGRPLIRGNSAHFPAMIEPLPVLHRRSVT